LREPNSRKPALRSAIELRRRLESTRTQERRARITDAANEAEQALYNVLRISPPQSSDQPNTTALTPRKPRVELGRIFRTWLDCQALNNVRHQLSLLVSTPSHHSHAQNREAKQQASIWASRYATHAVVLVLLLGIALMGGFKGLTVQAASVGAPVASSIDTGSFGGNDISASFNSYSALDGDAAAKADVANRVQIVTRFPDRVKGYTVQAGDTLASLATKFRVDKPTLMWANHIVDPDADLTPGATMLVLPVKGMYHTVEAGDTVESIAATYQVEPAAITSYKPNQLQPPYTLNVGDAIIVPGGSIPARDRIITYNPHPGETIGAVAQKFGLSVRTLLLANLDLGDGSALSSDNQLIVPPIDGIVHNVVAGDTIDSIATYYGVNPQVLVDFAPNHLKAGAQLTPDTVVMVPGGLEPTPTPLPSDTPQPTDTPAANATDTPQAKAKATPKPASSSRQQPTSRSSTRSSSSSSSSSVHPTSTPSSSSSAVIAAAKKVNSGRGLAHGSFIWPTYGTITQGFWAWEWGHRHGGLDIANSAGTPLVAADGGTVISAGWRSDGFGYCVIIDHGNGFKTLYGHMMRQPSVWVGEAVSRGQYLGPMGSTGNSTGPHVHFAIYYNDILRDPLNYLG
jgi:murein DD-endopeptidase MepM/ murein hydrolase activator NlpD/LysM repeat protein